MDWELGLYFLVAGALFWWLGYYGTKRLRIEKNRERAEAAARRKQEREAQNSNDQQSPAKPAEGGE